MTRRRYTAAAPSGDPRTARPHLAAVFLVAALQPLHHRQRAGVRVRARLHAASLRGHGAVQRARSRAARPDGARGVVAFGRKPRLGRPGNLVLALTQHAPCPQPWVHRGRSKRHSELGSFGPPPPRVRCATPPCIRGSSTAPRLPRLVNSAVSRYRAPQTHARHAGATPMLGIAPQLQRRAPERASRSHVAGGTHPGHCPGAPALVRHGA
jgi:hypothetical protein